MLAQTVLDTSCGSANAWVAALVALPPTLAGLATFWKTIHNRHAIEENTVVTQRVADIVRDEVASITGNGGTPTWERDRPGPS